MQEMFTFTANVRRMAGVDEVGRGPLAGPVVAAAVILDPARPIKGLADSKKLSPAKREFLAEEIKLMSMAWAIGRAEVKEIDELNILQASLLAMQRAVAALRIAPDFCQVDGNKLPHLPCPAEAIVKGDATIPAISAASILAKVYRDSEMAAMDVEYPGYGFALHKGYPTEQHRHALRQLGACAIHRRSYAPVQAVLKME